jgi:hypothetical protein
MKERGASKQEVEEALRSGFGWEPARFGRLQCGKDFEYGMAWRGSFYAMKQVHVIFSNEIDELVVVTVLVCYFNTEPRHENHL